MLFIKIIKYISNFFLKTGKTIKDFNGFNFTSYITIITNIIPYNRFKLGKSRSLEEAFRIKDFLEIIGKLSLVNIIIGF